MGHDILAQIAATKREEIAALRRHGLRGERTDAPRPFFAALQARTPVALIAEIKRASPSRGLLRADFDPAALAAAYAAGGAHCLSVLTDRTYFQGSWEALHAARQATSLPVLRKDFILDPLQVEETWRQGADALLLIVALLSRSLLADLLAQACERGLAALVEVHDERELEEALGVGAKLIGINNRNLRDFSVSLETTERLAPLVPASVTVVSESGIFTRADVERVRRAGARAVLVGEALMRQEDVAQAVRNLLGTPASLSETG